MNQSIFIGVQHMVAKITLQRYINQCDEIISANDSESARMLRKEILSVLSSDLDGLNRGIKHYGGILAYQTTHVSNEIDYINDLKILRGRLQVELEKEQNHMSDNINIYGNVSGSQIQQNTSYSSQSMINEMDVEKFQGILDQINKYRSQFPDEFGEKSDELIMALDQAQEALNTKNQPLWKKAIGVVRDIAIGVGSGLISAGILGLLPPA